MDDPKRSMEYGKDPPKSDDADLEHHHRNSALAANGVLRWQFLERKSGQAITHNWRHDTPPGFSHSLLIKLCAELVGVARTWLLSHSMIITTLNTMMDTGLRPRAACWDCPLLHQYPALMALLIHTSANSYGEILAILTDRLLRAELGYFTSPTIVS